MAEKKLSTRLLTLRKKFPGVSQKEMAPHFGLKLRMYQRYETGEVEPEDYKMRKIEQRIEFLERLEKLPPVKSAETKSTSDESQEEVSDKDALIAELRKDNKILLEINHYLTLTLHLKTAEENERKKEQKEQHKKKTA